MQVAVSGKGVLMARVQPDEKLAVELTVFDTMALASAARWLIKLRPHSPRDELTHAVLSRIAEACRGVLDSKGMYQDAEGAWKQRDEV